MTGQHEFRVTGSEVLLESPILAVRRDSVVMPGGHEAKREIVEHFGAVAVAAVDDAGRIALIRQYRHSVKRRLQELPAGLLDVDGESEIAGARRELAEEAQLAAENWTVIADLVTSPGFCEEACRVYLATGLAPADAGGHDGDEEADITLEWVDLAEARDRILRGEITNSIAVAGIFAASDVLSGRGRGRDIAEPFELRPTSLPGRRRAAGIGPDLKKI